MQAFGLLILIILQIFAVAASADENLFGYIKGAETLPKGSWEIYQFLTSRTDKGSGTYSALDSKTEIEYGVTDRLTSGFSLKMQSVKSQGLLLDAYIPRDIDSGVSPSGIEADLKYNFLSPAKDDIGLSTYFSLGHIWRDPHSGQEKDATQAELELLIQKYFMEGQMIGVINLGMESTYAQRYTIKDLPAGFEWPTHPEMEIAVKAGTALSYRFVANWFFGGEILYESEYETQVGQERWSTFLGPSLHYGSEKWWTTLTYFPQLQGGGSLYAGQTDTRLQLIERTKQEVRLKLGFNF